MAAYSGTVQVHGPGLSYYEERPYINITLSVGNLTRSGSTISASVSASLNALNSSLSYFGYSITVYAQLDSGTKLQLFSKPNSPNQWSSGTYSGSGTISATNTSTTATLSIWFESNCTCEGGEAKKVWSTTVSAPASSVTVTFDLNGGTRTGGGALTQTVTIGGSATAPTCTRTGYTFNGWNKSLSNITADTTITAKWTKVTYTVTYYANGGSNAPSAQTKEYGTALTLTTSKPTAPTYTVTFDANGGSCSTTSNTRSKTFKEWNTKSDGSGTSYASGGSYTGNANLNLYAIWTNPTYGTLPTPTWTNATFTGWYLEKSSSDANSTKISSSDTMTKSVTLYAHYNYTITYMYNASVSYAGDEDDSSGASDEDLGTFDTGLKYHGITYQLISDYPQNIAAKTFSNWNTKADGSGTSYAKSASYTTNAPLTLYAQYSTGKYTVIFDANGGTFSNGTTTKKYTNVSYGSQAGPPSDPTRKNHSFLGWLGNYKKITQDTTIKAMWDWYPLWIINSNNQWEPFK